MATVRIKTQRPRQVVDLTETLSALIDQHQVADGVCCVFLAHTTAALTTGEMGEGTEEDLLEVIERIIPRIRFRHAHDPSHAWSHMAASLLGPGLQIPIAGGKLALGTWQSVLLIELDGPRERDLHVTLLATRERP
jgi:secondary thiamine-phosphate synthase enzyme